MTGSPYSRPGGAAFGVELEGALRLAVFEGWAAFGSWSSSRLQWTGLMRIRPCLAFE
jgi:hypothetical protein